MKSASQLSVEELWDWVQQINGRFQTMRSFLYMCPMPAIIKDSLGRVLFLNKAAERLFDSSLKDMFGKTTLSFALEAQKAEAIGEQDGIVLREAQPRVFFNELRSRAGDVARYTVLKFAFEDEFGERYLGWIAMSYSEGRFAWLKKLLP